MKPEGSHNEADLIAGINRGSREAFEAIYRSYAPELFRIIQHNVTIREDCEELLHDVFEQLWTKHKDLRIVALRPYLLKMTHNRIINFFKHNQVKKKYERHFLQFEAIYDQLDDEERETIDPEIIHSLLDNCLPQLPERCQTAFRLRLNGYSNGQIAESMNIKKDTVENYVIRALAHLRNSYKSFFKAG